MDLFGTDVLSNFGCKFQQNYVPKLKFPKASLLVQPIFRYAHCFLKAVSCIFYQLRSLPRELVSSKAPAL